MKRDSVFTVGGREVPENAPIGQYDVELELHGGGAVGEGPGWDYTEWKNVLEVVSGVNAEIVSSSIESGSLFRVMRLVFGTRLRIRVM